MIPELWIKEYIDKLIALAATLPSNSEMQKTVILRADYAMDMVAEWRESSARLLSMLPDDAQSKEDDE